MKHRPIGWSLPRPKLMHHMVEDFITEWESAVSHIQPLRRFLEHTTQTDLRAYYAGKVSSWSWLVHLRITLRPYRESNIVCNPM